MLDRRRGLTLPDEVCGDPEPERDVIGPELDEFGEGVAGLAALAGGGVVVGEGQAELGPIRRCWSCSRVRRISSASFPERARTCMAEERAASGWSGST